MIEQELRPGDVLETVGAGKDGPQTSYFRFLQADYNHPPTTPSPSAPTRPLPSRGPLAGAPDPAPPEQREAVMGALFEVHLAGEGYAHLVGQTVRLRWSDDALANTRFWGVTQGDLRQERPRGRRQGGGAPRAGEQPAPRQPLRVARRVAPRG